MNCTHDLCLPGLAIFLTFCVIQMFIVNITVHCVQENEEAKAQALPAKVNCKVINYNCSKTIQNLVNRGSLRLKPPVKAMIPY